MAANETEYPAGEDALSADRKLLSRAGVVEQVTAVLRTRISEGYFAPGTRLSEVSIGNQLDISRNTLREAFRLLTHEGLVEHKMNRGMFVRQLGVADVSYLYRVRKLVECDAVRTVTEPPATIDRIARAVSDGRAAAAGGRWQDLGTADIHFHLELTALSPLPRMSELMNGIFAELRLAFHVMTELREFHEPYLVRNEEILRMLEAGDGAKAECALAEYLDDAERQLIAAYERTTAEPPPTTH